MKSVKFSGAVGAFVVLLTGATAAYAVDSYSLKCTGPKDESITMALTGFTVKLNSADDAASGAAAAKRNAFSVTIRFAPSKEFGALWSMVQENEVLRSCKLTDNEGTDTTAADNWGAMAAAPKNKSNKNKNNAQPARTDDGAMEWILSNATVTSVTAIGRQATTGAADGEMEATLDAQQITFTM